MDPGIPQGSYRALFRYNEMYLNDSKANSVSNPQSELKAS